MMTQRYLTKSKIQQGVYKITQLTQEDVDPQPDGEPGMSSSQRKWEQVQKIINNDQTERLSHKYPSL